jgi:hypothetical protein
MAAMEGAWAQFKRFGANDQRIAGVDPQKKQTAGP